MQSKFLAVGTIFLVLLFHAPAVYFDWYFYFWWYDVFMHWLGGVAMGFLGFWLWEVLAPVSLRNSWKVMTISLFFVLGFVALVGIGWEWAEGLADAFFLPRIGFTDAQLGLVDTMFDLYFDLAGGAMAWLFFTAYREIRSRV